MIDALQIAARNSPDYQSRKEEVFRVALALDLERNSFRIGSASSLDVAIAKEWELGEGRRVAAALEQARHGRLQILDQMEQIIGKPRTDLSTFAPRLFTLQIPKEKIRDVIGKGGVVIRGLQEETGTTIEIEDDGPGIPRDLQDSVFYPLVTSRPEGTGLGLPAAQELISRHDGLIEFDQALAAIQEHLEASGLAAPPLPAPVATETPPPTPAPRTALYLAWLVVFLTGLGGGAWIYLKNEEAKEQQRQTRLGFLANQGSIMVENRRWQDAAGAFAEIEAIDPGSTLARLGRRSIEVGMVEEQTQFIGYWIGQATAELEAGRLDEATAAARQVLAKFPAEKEALSLLEKVATARANLSRNAAIAEGTPEAVVRDPAVVQSYLGAEAV